MIDKALRRTRDDKMLTGVCGGLARYFNIDPVIVRLVFVMAVFLGGVSPLIYLLLWIIMPLDGAVMPLTTTHAALPDHPRPVEEWKYDPYTGEVMKK